MSKKDFWSAVGKLLAKGAVWCVENPEVVAGFIGQAKAAKK